MAITNVDRTRLSEPSYARYCIINGCDAKIRCQITALHGADLVKKWESVDSTQYQIDDDDYNNAYDRGQQNAKDATGYDGHKSYRAVVDGVVDTAANVVGQTVIKSAVTAGAKAAAEEAAKEAAKAAAEAAAKKAAEEAAKKAAEAAAEEAAKKAAEEAAKKAAEEAAKKAAEEAAKKAAEEAAKKKAEEAAKKASFIIGCTLGLAEGIKYQASKPNQDQVEAARVLRDEQLPTSQGDLESTQEMMAEAAEEIEELTEEADEANEDANDKIEDDKTLMDYYRAQYNALKAKVDSGQALTPDEKALMKKLAPLMEDLAGDINDTNDDASDTVNELYDEIEGHQDTYDTSAETIAEVEGVTDYAEGFDESTQVMCYVEGGVQTLNAGLTSMAAYKAGKFAASGGWLTAWAWAFAAMGATGAALSGAGAAEQFKWASEVSAEIDTRETTQELGSATQETYDTELDNFASSMEYIEDLEIEIPEDMEVPEEITIPEGNSSSDGTNGANGANGSNPLIGNTGSNGANGNGNTNGANGNGNNGNSPSGIPNTKDPNYVNNMGNGSDWHEVASGNIKRDSDDDIVKDGSGKVVLIGQYGEAITSVTGAKEGEYFSKDDIPQILERLLGDPFDAKTIKKIHNGKKVDSDFAAKILGTKNQDDKGSGNVDNTNKATEVARRVVNFYWPIFEQASKKGWVKG